VSDENALLTIQGWIYSELSARSSSDQDRQDSSEAIRDAIIRLGDSGRLDSYIMHEPLGSGLRLMSNGRFSEPVENVVLTEAFSTELGEREAAAGNDIQALVSCISTYLQTHPFAPDC
jgi:hypothetical protein